MRAAQNLVGYGLTSAFVVAARTPAPAVLDHEPRPAPGVFAPVHASSGYRVYW
jgi:hypothetical protein